MSAGSNAWANQEHVLAGPFADLLRRACAEVRSVPGRSSEYLAAVRPATSTGLLERRYAERFGTTERTAMRHFSLVLSQPTVPVIIADRVAALCGVPFAFVEATCLSA